MTSGEAVITSHVLPLVSVLTLLVLAMTPARGQARAWCRSGRVWSGLMFEAVVRKP